MTHFDRYARAGLFALAAAAAACSSSDAEPNPSGGSQSAPAVMVAVATRSPEGMNLYVGAYPELPAEPDLSQMVETVNGQGRERVQRSRVRVGAGVRHVHALRGGRRVPPRAERSRQVHAPGRYGQQHQRGSLGYWQGSLSRIIQLG